MYVKLASSSLLGVIYGVRGIQTKHLGSAAWTCLSFRSLRQRGTYCKLLTVVVGCETPLKRLMDCACKYHKGFSQFVTIFSFFSLNPKLGNFSVYMYIYFFSSLFFCFPFPLISNAYLLLILGLLKFVSH